jgi:hypothetical protein
MTCGARDEGTSFPRCFVTLKPGEMRACAAVAPRQTTSWGFRIPISASSQSRQAAISLRFGFSWSQPLTGGPPLEVLHRIGDVDGFAFDTRRLERLIEHSAGGAHERLAGDVLLIAGLLADEDHLRRPAAIAEHGLRRVLPQVARPAMRRGVAPRAEALGLRELRIPMARLRRRRGRIRLCHVGLTEQAPRPKVRTCALR